MGPKLFEGFFLAFLVSFFVFVRLLGLRGQAGGREGGGFFLRETLIPSHFCFPRFLTKFYVWLLLLS